MIPFECNWSIFESAREMFVAIASKDIIIKVEQARTHGCRHFYNTRVSRSCKCHKKFSRIAMRKSTDCPSVGRTCQSTSSSFTATFVSRNTTSDTRHFVSWIIVQNSELRISDEAELSIKKYQIKGLNKLNWLINKKIFKIKYSFIRFKKKLECENVCNNFMTRFKIINRIV